MKKQKGGQRRSEGAALKIHMKIAVVKVQHPDNCAGRQSLRRWVAEASPVQDFRDLVVEWVR